METEFECRRNCGACCIAPSISSFIPNMPQGKMANAPCIHLDNNFNCLLFEDKSRPAVCERLQANIEMCGTCREEALSYLQTLETLTLP